MKLLLIDYLASLRERDEIDAILPDLLTQMGGTPVKLARRGESEQGKDVCALFGPDDSRELWIFVIKQGDLTEDMWQGSGKMRIDAENAIDVPFEDQSRGIDRTTKRRVVLLHNGTTSETIRYRVNAFCQWARETRGVEVERWDIHGLADRCADHLLGERLLADPEAAHLLRQTLVFVTTADYDLRHFNQLLDRLSMTASKTVRSIHQTLAITRLVLRFIVKYTETYDIRPAIKAHELALLRLWDWMLREDLIGHKLKWGPLLVDYMSVLGEYTRRLSPQIGSRYGLALAARGESRDGDGVSLRRAGGVW